MNRSEQLHQLIRAAFPEEGPGIGVDERIFHDASTEMRQAQIATRQNDFVSKWRRIMRSPITRTAAVIAVIVGAIWGYNQSVENSANTHGLVHIAGGYRRRECLVRRRANRTYCQSNRYFPTT